MAGNHGSGNREKETIVRQTTRAAGFLAVLVFASACGSGDPNEAAVKDMLAGLNELSDILDTVKDEASAKAAAPKLKAIADRMTDVKKRFEGIPAEKRTELQNKYKDQMMAAGLRFMAAGKKVSEIPGVEALFAETMKAMQ